MAVVGNSAANMQSGSINMSNGGEIAASAFLLCRWESARGPFFLGFACLDSESSKAYIRLAPQLRRQQNPEHTRPKELHRQTEY